MAPRPPLLGWYGDDFTGSTDVLEALGLGGLRARLFAAPPTPEALAEAGELDAVGIAGEARSRSPEWMREHLPEAFAALRDSGARLIHYKVCSTFDSSPTLGSIGCALEIGQDLLDTPCVPILVGAPSLGRWVMFGTLFARAGDGAVYRLDRHPTMSRHPATPMDEADLARHLARQTARPIHGLDLRGLEAAAQDGAAALRRAAVAGARALVLDGHDAATLAAGGRLLLGAVRGQGRDGGPVFVIGSSGVEHALAAARNAPVPERPAPGAAGPVLVLSGSASPQTAAQIAQGERAGFAAFRLDPLDPRAAEALHAPVLAALERGPGAILYTARGPGDDSLGAIRAALGGPEATGPAIGGLLGRLWSRLGAARRIPRVVVCGGDTASHACQEVGARWFDLVAPLAPGSPLIRLAAHDPGADGAEVVLKGGQVGGPRLFEAVAAGSAALAVAGV
ncbi:four-carbon acid sugar kinase family protein [Roseomonas sp. OT10]|uniref:four-carbon acid sugar kinase family protein n=1 Tax=Roseomonas cutis TaxID=2897332 RepID=UPI001E3C7044|nr:four-carbon acid sugar kinase family protein [Roseomonas sp. OT10]UFN47579.1 four-carbon acid sugar kinase family protein [Roseomonas sp. OT10]